MIAVAIEVCIILRVQGESSHLCLGLMDKAAFGLGLEGWAVHFAMMTNKQQEQRLEVETFGSNSLFLFEMRPAVPGVVGRRG